MSLADRRANAPQHLGPIPTFELHTPIRALDNMLPIHRLNSSRSIDTIDSGNLLPTYEAEEDNNPDVITTSVEIDPEEGESDVETTPRPKTVTRTEQKFAKRSGMSKLFSRSLRHPTNCSPGVRITRLPRLLKSHEKDIRAGFPLDLPYVDGTPVLEVESSAYTQAMLRVNMLLSSGAVKDVQKLIETQASLRDRVSFVKLADVQRQKYQTITSASQSPAAFYPSSSPSFLTIPEINPSTAANQQSDDESSLDQYSMGRRGSAISTTSTSSTKSSFSQRIRTRFERKEEWCLLFE